MRPKSKIVKRKGQTKSKYNAREFAAIDGESPYAEYLPARFKQYAN